MNDPLDDTKVIRLSATQISMFLRCARQWSFRYVEHLRVPPSGALKLGTCFHSAAERNYRQKASTRADLPMDEQTDFFSTLWDDELQREEVIFDKEAGESPGTLKDVGVAVVKEHHSKIAPVVIPQSAETVEEKIILPLVSKETGVSYELDARIDLTDINGIIRDNKALGRSPNQDDVNRDLQLSTYALAKRLQTRKAETALALDIVVKNKTPRAVTLITERTREHLQLHLNTTGHIAKAIQAEAFPRNPTGWWCSKKFCGYWSRCMGKGIPEVVDLGQQQDLEPALKQSVEQTEAGGK